MREVCYSNKIALFPSSFSLYYPINNVNNKNLKWKNSEQYPTYIYITHFKNEYHFRYVQKQEKGEEVMLSEDSDDSSYKNSDEDD